MPNVEGLPIIDQPGLGRLREAVVAAQRDLPRHGRDVIAFAQRALPERAHLARDGVAGLNDALASVPDGMASGLLAGVNPVYGLYACMAGPAAGGLISSTQLMVITTTSASALAAGQTLLTTPSDERAGALFLMVILIGAFQVLFGLLKLGRLTRFVSYSVMTGFIIGIAVLTVMTQLPAATAYEPSGSNRISQTVDILLHPGELDFTSVGLTLLTLALLVAFRRAFLANLSSLVGVVVPSALVLLLGLEGVQIVEDVGEVPQGVPLPALPSLSALSVELVTGAMAVAAIIVVQGAGVSQTVPNPDGARRSMSRDFTSQGVANIASGLFQGIPVGASLGTTAVNVLSGARSRLAAILAGAWMALVIVALGGVVAEVAMPALAGLLIAASASTIKPDEAEAVWRIGWPSRLPLAVTFLATLLLDVQIAVGVGVVLSAVLYVLQSSTDVTVLELVDRPDGRLEEKPAPKRLKPDSVTVLDIYGQIFFAGARKVERLLPRPEGVERPVVLLRMRGHTNMGATMVDVLSEYAHALEEAGGRLYISGLSNDAHEQLHLAEGLDVAGPVHVFEATPILWESTARAMGEAEAWLIRRRHRDNAGRGNADH